MSNPTIAIVGSGPIGSTYARVLLEQVPNARVVMFEAGPQLTAVPGESVRNIPDAGEKARAREMSQGPQAGAYRESLGIPAGTVTEGMFTARQGTHLLDFGGAGSAHASSFPAAAAATNVGGQGAHWTCATPSPAFSEKIPFIADDEWDALIEDAKQLLHVHSAAFADSKVGEAIRSLLDEEFGAELPDGYGVGTLPVAGDPQPDGSVRWAGADVVLGPLIDKDSPLSKQFELRDLTLVRRVELDGHRVTGVTVQDLRTGRRVVCGSGHRCGGGGCLPLPAAPVGIRCAAEGARALPDRAPRGHLHGGAGRRKDGAVRHRRGPQGRTGPACTEPGRPRSRREPHSVLRAGAPLLRPGDVHRDHAIPDGAGNPLLREPLGLRQHGLRHAQAPPLRGRRHL